jgi:hypothetical protein
MVACGDNHPGNITIHTDEFSAVLTEYAKVTPYLLPVVPRDQAKRDGFAITVVRDAALPAQAYQLSHPAATELVVAASDDLGAQYGTSAALEALGFRFRHPYDTFVPEFPELGAIDEEVHRPQIRQRGLHLHTLHPAEGYFAFWEPSPQNKQDAHRVIDWLIKNRGNYIQWFALDDIITDPQRYAAWKPYTEELIAYAHARGIEVGIAFQLFGASNLQLSFDLVDEEDQPFAEQISARLPLLTALPFDTFQLSFGEFFDSDPQLFIDAVNEVYTQTHALAPQAEFHALVHVGATQRVVFQGEDLIYYFLVKFADPAIVSDVHTTMFYNLYEPAHGAYQHVDFSEHREYLLDRMCNGLPHAYFPETAYWVAFDNSVPQFFPLYIHNRWLDLQQLDAEPGCGPLDNHLLFSTGWEWGYWLHDVTALRAGYELPASPTDLVAAELSDRPEAVAPIVKLIDLQREHLMGNELVQYIAGRDTAIDAGRQLGIVSQPDRVLFDDLVAGAADPTVFETTVMAPLETYAAGLDDVARELDAAELPDDRWTRELRDGVAIDRVRTRFVIETYGATLAQLAGDPAGARSHLDRATELMAQGQSIVDRRHDDLHDSFGNKLIENQLPNRTFYQFGYLFMADTLCYWNRELVQVTGIVTSTSEPTPSCLF